MLLSYLLTHPIETLGALLSVVGIWLNTQGNRWGWLVGVGGTLCYIWVFGIGELHGNFLLNIYFLLSSVYGFFAWKPASSVPRPFRRLGLSKFGGVLVLALAVGLGLAQLLHSKGTTAQQLDTLTTTLSVIAQILLVGKITESWLLWLVADVVYVYMYWAEGWYASLVLYAVLCLLALRGFWYWHKTDNLE